MRDYERMWEAQVEEVKFLRKQVDKLRKELARYKLAFREKTVRVDKSYRDRASYFDRVGGMILKMFPDMVRRHPPAVDYKVIIEEFQRRYRNVDVDVQTIMRQTRKLAENGVIHRVKDGLFTIKEIE